jgi:amidohydrolase
VTEVSELKTRARAAIDAEAEALVALSHRIHAHPEVAFQEVEAAGWLATYLGERGYQLTTGVGSLPTAFRATAGAGGPVLAVLAEYDALPGIGHGCGHNIIATAGAGAAAGLIAVIDELPGTVQIIGTPAEEVYGGKVAMIREGAFDGIDAAIMTHPSSRDSVLVGALACAELKVEYAGREAHASAQPERGVNALEALIIAFSAINSLRQHMKRSARVHGIITHGGEAPNIVPGYAAGSFLVRAADDDYLEKLKVRVEGCFDAGAKATGATLKLTWNENQYAAMTTNGPLAEAHRINLSALGREVPQDEEPRALGSTDMGNVSRIMPAIHPMIAIAPQDVNGHSPQFAEYAASDAGDRAVIDGAKALAMTAIDYLTNDDLRRLAREEFERGRTPMAPA